MKTITLLFLYLILSVGAVSRKGPIYQVISQHPHDVEHFGSHVETVKEDGRLWLVTVKPGAPASVYQSLRMVADQKIGSVKPQLIKRTADPLIQQVVANVSADNIRADVVHLSSYRNRAVGSEDNKKAVAWVQSKLQGLGYQVEQICYREGSCSVIANKVGALAQEVLLVEAHIDSVGRDYAGADDNASGTAALLEMARILSTQTLNRSLRFFVTNGEEGGLLGAKHYVRQLANSGELANLKMVINMDMVGYNSNGVVELETNSEFENLAQEFAQWTHDYTTLKSKITLGAWGSDHVPFLERKVPAILTIENWSTKTPFYHTSCDKPDTLNYAYAAEIAKLNVAAVMERDKN
jgi:hypothetical protein